MYFKLKCNASVVDCLTSLKISSEVIAKRNSGGKRIFYINKCIDINLPLLSNNNLNYSNNLLIKPELKFIKNKLDQFSFYF